MKALSGIKKCVRPGGGAVIDTLIERARSFDRALSVYYGGVTTGKLNSQSGLITGMDSIHDLTSFDVVADIVNFEIGIR